MCAHFDGRLAFADGTRLTRTIDNDYSAVVLDHNGNFADGGTPSPNSSLVENVNVSPTRILSIDGVICADSSGASVDC